MIEWIKFQNFRVLRDTTLPLERFTLLVGPNGSGKSTVFRALRFFHHPSALKTERSLGSTGEVELSLKFEGVPSPVKLASQHNFNHDPPQLDQIRTPGIRIYSLHDQAIAEAAKPDGKAELRENGGNLAAVLDRIKDQDEERWEALNVALAEWLPGFDRILFSVEGDGMKAVELRTKPESFRIPAAQLSQGTLVALAILTLSYLPQPPTLICLEEPDRGLHPRLLQEVQNAIRRLCYPEEFGEARSPVQVIATTHNPFFLDLFRDSPEQIVIAEKHGLEARFKRLSDHPNLKEIIAGVPLGEVWYSGVLGGVPAGT